MTRLDALGSPGPEDMRRLEQEAYRQELLETAKKGQNVTVERLLAIEQRVKRKLLSPDEHAK